MGQAIVLFAHGARDPRWAEPFEAVAARVRATAPGCPVAGEMPGMVKDALLTVPGIGDVTVNMTFDPPWTPDRMSEEAKLELNMF